MTALAWTLGVALASVGGPPNLSHLTLMQVAPQHELQKLEDAAEIRVVFSEPMVPLGALPQPVQASFFHLTPAVPGAFRWAGDRTLIFTPRSPLPYSTRYRLTIGMEATAVSGRRFLAPFSFSFTTPTVRLESVEPYRRDGRHDRPVVLAMRFNQPVDPGAIAAHLLVESMPHDWTPPSFSAPVRARLYAVDPAAVTDLQDKVNRTVAVVASQAGVPVGLASDWDKKAFPPADNLVVVETRQAPPTDTWLKVVLDATAVGRQGTASPGAPQQKVVRLEPTLFVTGFRCVKDCDPDSYNALRTRSKLRVMALRKAITVTDITDPMHAVAVTAAKPAAEDEEEEAGGSAHDGDPTADWQHSSSVSLDELGFSLKPARRYAVEVARGLASIDGQTLGYTWCGIVESSHQRAFTGFGGGHGVWEAKGGTKVPYSARNLKSVTEWVAPVTPEQLAPLAASFASGWRAPDGEGKPRTLKPKADVTQAYALDLSPVLSPAGTGIAWAALQDGAPIAGAPLADSTRTPKSTLIQVTNLGLTVKDSPDNTLVLVTRLDDGRPVPGAKVTIRKVDNQVVWTGETDASGVALAPNTDLRNHETWWNLTFIVTAEKDGDLAYLASDWTSGTEPWDFEVNYDLDEAGPMLRGAVIADRGVYRQGEEVHLKLILRTDTARGVSMLPPGTRASVTLRDSRAEDVETRQVTLGEWGSADWTVTVPASGALGYYYAEAKVEGQNRSVTGSFLVAAYRRPDFRVDVNLAGESTLAGGTLTGVVQGRYLFGGAMAGRTVNWTFSRKRVEGVPAPVAERFPEDRYAFLARGEAWQADDTVQQQEAVLDAEGRLKLDLETDMSAGVPLEYVLEGEVTDLSRQTIAGRASFLADPAPWYIGLRRPPFFATAGTGFDTDVVAVDPQGRPVPDVKVKVRLVQVQWHSVRRAEGQGFYAWDTERKEVEVGTWDVTSQAQAVPLHVPLAEGGSFILSARAEDAQGRSTTTSTWFFALGPGYTAWARYEHNRIDLVPEKKTYKPGETARILVQSPWEKATALLTTEREGVRTHRTFDLASTQETVSVPITEADVPNVFVSIVLVKGRTGDYSEADTSDPGKPAFRVGYTALKVDDGRKRLGVTLRTDRAEYRPASRASVDVAVRDPEGKGAPSEVTLWAVDYGVLSLTGYKTPDVRGSVWVEKALQVLTEDSRFAIISRRSTEPKGEGEGGGGGSDGGPAATVRKDFRPLAFWLGSVITDSKGRARAQVTLPDSLTTYRVMAVAGDKISRFGAGELEIRVSKPVLMTAAFPRFLTAGDRARFGATVHNQLKQGGNAIVTMQSLDPAVLTVEGEARQTLELAGGGASEVRFDVRALAVGRARVQMSVRLQGEQDAFEEVLPVRVVTSPEVTAVHGEAAPRSEQTLELPAGVAPTYGGLSVELSSTALSGLGEGARYLVEYPYGCAEQRASAALALLLAADLGKAFHLPGVEPDKMIDVARATLLELKSFQCTDGGFGYWKGDCGASAPYLTAYVLSVLERAKALGHPVPADMLERGYTALEAALEKVPAPGEPDWAPFSAWQAFAARQLALAGRKPDSTITRLLERADRMPVFALAYLWDAAVARGHVRAADLERRVRNAIFVESGTAHVEERRDPALLWLWSSNVRSTAIVLSSLLRHAPDDPAVSGLARWLVRARVKGRWGNTQENATAIAALVDYYRAREAEEPDFMASVQLGPAPIVQREFRGRSSEAVTSEVPMASLLSRGAPGEALPLTFTREGTGTLFYGARLRYAPGTAPSAPLEAGMRVLRRYTLLSGGDAARRFEAGALVKVTLTLQLSQERRFVALVDPLPAGFEPVESYFATTAADLRKAPTDEPGIVGEEEPGWIELWQRGGFDHVERHDDHVQLFATRLGEGTHVFSYVVRATTAGTFGAGPARAEEMYAPEVFGRTAGDQVEVAP